MNCEDTKTHKEDYLEGKLSSLQQYAYEQHLLGCRSCSEEVKGMKNLQKMLQGLAVPESSDGFEEDVFKEVRRQYPEKATGGFSVNPFVAGFATAMAAGFALWFISTLFVVQQQSLPDANEMMLSMNASQTVRLMFDAPSDIDQVRLTISLPGNIELTGYSGQSEISWQTSITKGQNILSLPIRAVEQGAGKLVAQLNYGDKVKKFHLVIKTLDDGAMSYQIQALESV